MNNLWPAFLIAVLTCTTLIFVIYYFISTNIRAIPKLLQSTFTDSREPFEKVFAAFDDFVRNRLGNELPVVSMFLDEPFIEEINSVFRHEVERTLPSLLPELLGDSRVITSMIRKRILKGMALAWIVAVLCGTFAGSWILSALH